MTRVLVTGSDGLVGTALRELIKNDCYFATRADGDLRIFQEVEKVFLKVKPDKVIHLAAVVGGLGGNLLHPGELFRDNSLININVLELSRIYKVEKLVSLMSTCVFPAEARFPLTIDQLHGGSPHESSFGYAYAKRMLEVQSAAYRKEFGCNFVTIIPTNIYGPADNWNLENGHVIPSLIHKFYLAKKASLDVSLWGTGSPYREFIFSKDVARLILWTLSNYNDTLPLILSPSDEISIKNLAEMVSEEIGFQGDILWESEKPDGQLRKPSSSAELQSLIPNLSFTPLQQGIKETVDWFVVNYPNLRL